MKHHLEISPSVSEVQAAQETEKSWQEINNELRISNPVFASYLDSLGTIEKSGQERSLSEVISEIQTTNSREFFTAFLDVIKESLAGMNCRRNIRAILEHGFNLIEEEKTIPMMTMPISAPALNNHGDFESKMKILNQ
jgi:hypothetical protein